MRGEDASGVRRYGAELETPPHAWGRLFVVKVCAPNVRNTPTCVGKTALMNSIAALYEKHPHMRGEDKSRCRL